jgi:hypothetical protein
MKKPNQHCLHFGYDMLAFFGIQDVVFYCMLLHFISASYCIHHDSMPVIRARIRGGPARQLPRAPIFMGH